MTGERDVLWTNAGFFAAFWGSGLGVVLLRSISGATALAAHKPVIERWNACLQTWLLLTAQLPHLGLWVPVIEHGKTRQADSSR